jgi:hypothetical protein
MSVCLSLCMSFSLLGEIIWKLRQKKEFIPLFPPDGRGYVNTKLHHRESVYFYTLLRHYFSLCTHKAGLCIRTDLMLI